MGGLRSVRSGVQECDLTERHNQFWKATWEHIIIAGPPHEIFLFNLNIWLSNKMATKCDIHWINLIAGSVRMRIPNNILHGQSWAYGK